jgi:hypothetical protein
MTVDYMIKHLIKLRGAEEDDSKRLSIGVDIVGLLMNDEEEGVGKFFPWSLLGCSARKKSSEQLQSWFLNTRNNTPLLALPFYDKSAVYSFSLTTIHLDLILPSLPIFPLPFPAITPVQLQTST